MDLLMRGIRFLCFNLDRQAPSHFFTELLLAFPLHHDLKVTVAPADALEFLLELRIRQILMIEYDIELRRASRSV